MKIAIVCNNLSLITGGPRLIFALASGLTSIGNTVTIYAPDFNPAQFAEISRGLAVRVVKPKSVPLPGARMPGFLGWIMGKWREERYAIALAQAIAEEIGADADVVNVHDFSYRTAYFVKWRNPRAQAVWHENAPIFAYVKRGKLLHDLLGFLYYRVFRALADRKYFRAMDKLIVLDRVNEENARRQGFRDITMVRAGIDFEKFYAPVRDFGARAARKQASILAVGALNAYRRYDNVIDAVKLLREWGYDARARIMANNLWREDQCRDALVAQVARHKLEPYVSLQFTAVSEAEIVKTFRACDVFVQAVYSPPPSHHGWGLVNFEAMAAGVPVVLVGSATATEVLKDGENALFFEPLNALQIAEKVKSLVDDPDAYARIARAGQQYVKEHQSWKRYAEEVSDVFRK